MATELDVDRLLLHLAKAVVVVQLADLPQELLEQPLPLGARPEPDCSPDDLGEKGDPGVVADQARKVTRGGAALVRPRLRGPDPRLEADPELQISSFIRERKREVLLRAVDLAGAVGKAEPSDLVDVLCLARAVVEGEDLRER